MDMKNIENYGSGLIKLFESYRCCKVRKFYRI